eukprot:scaffold174351_cov29-Tisochrysis_lutea.AAC.5
MCGTEVRAGKPTPTELQHRIDDGGEETLGLVRQLARERRPRRRLGRLEPERGDGSGVFRLAVTAVRAQRKQRNLMNWSGAWRAWWPMAASETRMFQEMALMSMSGVSAHVRKRGPEELHTFKRSVALALAAYKAYTRSSPPTPPMSTSTSDASVSELGTSGSKDLPTAAPDPKLEGWTEEKALAAFTTSSARDESGEII